MYYGFNDDVTIRNIISGALSGRPDGHAVYMKYPLTGILALLYRVAGFLPWYSLFMAACFCAGIFAFLLGALKLSGRENLAGRLFGGVFAASFAALFFVPNLFLVHYTIAAAVLAAGALFLVAVSDRAVFPAILLWLCYCTRSQVFFLALPFLMVVMTWKALDKKWRCCLRFLGIFAAAVVVAFGINKAMYSGDDWKYYEKYNEVRTDIYDYAYAWFPEYERDPEFYEEYGFGYEEYMLFQEYDLVLDKDVDLETMKAMRDAIFEEKQEVLYGREYLKKVGMDYYYYSFYTRRPYDLLVIFLYLILLALLVVDRKIGKALLVVGMGIGRSVIWLFLIWRGRFPERIIMTLYILEFSVLAGLVLVMTVLAQKKARQWIPAFLGILFFICSVGRITDAYKEAKEQAKTQKEWECLADYLKANEENTYIIDVYSSTSYTDAFWNGDTSRNNYFLAGGWLERSPLFGERLKELGAKDGAWALAAGENVFFAAGAERDLSWLEAYMKKRFPEKEFTKADDVTDGERTLFVIYKCE